MYSVANSHKRRLAAVSLKTAYVEATDFIVRSIDPTWAEVRYISDAIGSGVFMLEGKAKNSFLLEYRGELITAEEALAKETDEDQSVFRFFFKHGKKELCIDSTNEPTTGPRLARLVNHSNEGNAKPLVVMVNGKPHICLFANKTISPGEQVLYNYGLKHLPFEDLITGATRAPKQKCMPVDESSCSTHQPVSQCHGTLLQESSSPLNFMSNLADDGLVSTVETATATYDNDNDNVESCAVPGSPGIELQITGATCASKQKCMPVDESSCSTHQPVSQCHGTLVQESSSPINFMSNLADDGLVSTVEAATATYDNDNDNVESCPVLGSPGIELSRPVMDKQPFGTEISAGIASADIVIKYHADSGSVQTPAISDISEFGNIVAMEMSTGGGINSVVEDLAPPGELYSSSITVSLLSEETLGAMIEQQFSKNADKEHNASQVYSSMFMVPQHILHRLITAAGPKYYIADNPLPADYEPPGKTDTTLPADYEPPGKKIKSSARKTDSYPVSRNGKPYKRLKFKKSIQFPQCPATVKSIQQHLMKCHKLTHDAAVVLLSNTDSYRRRGAKVPKPRKPCPYANCHTKVTHIGNHLRNVHKTTALEFKKQQMVSSELSINNDIPNLLSDTDSIVTSAPQCASNSALCIDSHYGCKPLFSGASQDTSELSNGSSKCTNVDCVDIVPPSPKLLVHRAPFVRCDLGQLAGKQFSNNSRYDDDESKLLLCATATSQIDEQDNSDHNSSYSLEEEASATGCSDNETGVADCSDSPTGCSDNETGVADCSDDSNCIANIIAAFHTYISSIDGGCKSRPEMYSLAAKQILSAVGNTIDALTKENVRRLYVEPLLKQNQAKTVSAKTVRNKLRCIEYFCTFIEGHLNHDITLATDEVASEIRANMLNLKKCLPFWRQSLRSRCTIDEVRRRVQDGSDLIPSEAINKYMVSDYAKFAVGLLCSSNASNSLPSVYDFVKARNHLLIVLSVGNAHRTGVLINFTLEEFKTGKLMDGGRMVFSVCDQKTAKLHGAATIAVSAEEAQLLRGYIKIRKMPYFDNAKPFVFINSSGTQMTQSHVATAMTSAFNTCGYKVRVSCTKLRKTAVTEIHTNYQSCRQDVATHMCHRLSTAEKNYKYTEKQRNSLTCSEVIKQALTTSTSAPQLPMPTEPPSDSLQTEPDDEPQHEPYKKAIRWSTEDRDLVRSKFSKFVIEKKTPIAEIRRILESSDKLRVQLESNLGICGSQLEQAVRAKVRSFFRWTK